MCLCILCLMDWFLLASFKYGVFMRIRSSVLGSVNVSFSLYCPYTFPKHIQAVRARGIQKYMLLFSYLKALWNLFFQQCTE